MSSMKKISLVSSCLLLSLFSCDNDVPEAAMQISELESEFLVEIESYPRGKTYPQGTVITVKDTLLIRFEPIPGSNTEFKADVFPDVQFVFSERLNQEIVFEVKGHNKSGRFTFAPDQNEIEGEFSEPYYPFPTLPSSYKWVFRSLD